MGGLSARPAPSRAEPSPAALSDGEIRPCQRATERVRNLSTSETTVAANAAATAAAAAAATSSITRDNRKSRQKNGRHHGRNCDSSEIHCDPVHAGDSPAIRRDSISEIQQLRHF